MKRRIDLGPEDICFLSCRGHTVGAVKACRTRHVFIETATEELVQFLEPEDLIAVSAFSGGARARNAIACMLYLVREAGLPLLALRRGHPASARLPLVVSAGSRIRLTGCIVPGTHPEQDVLCARGALDGATLAGVPGGLVVEGGPGIRSETRAFLFNGPGK